MEKRIQIPLALYTLMVEYIRDHYDPNDQQRFTKIRFGIEQKQQAEVRRNLYSAYKAEADPETREMLRTSYLDKAGIPSSWRWGEETEKTSAKETLIFDSDYGRGVSRRRPAQ